MLFSSCVSRFGVLKYVLRLCDVVYMFRDRESLLYVCTLIDVGRNC